LEALDEQQTFYASNGITTAQDGHSGFETVVLLSKAAAQHRLFIDIEALAGYQIIDKILGSSEYKFGDLKDHFKIAGFKLIADGSPQGKTAYFTKPYLTDVPGCDHDNCTGIPTVTQQQFDDAILKGYKNNIQTFVHCNGDATIDMYIHAIKYADSALHTTSLGRRSVVIHSQFVRPDQLDTYHNFGIVAALFSNHAFFWGDTHTQNLGVERASFLSPLKTAIKKQVVATNHTDYGVTPLNQLFLLWTSVARESRTGKIIGASERLTPIEGLRAITINGAYEYFEEKSKGSIEKGKLAVGDTDGAVPAFPILAGSVCTVLNKSNNRNPSPNNSILRSLKIVATNADCVDVLPAGKTAFGLDRFLTAFNKAVAVTRLPVAALASA